MAGDALLIRGGEVVDGTGDLPGRVLGPDAATSTR
jgi:hypothetical protein